MIEVEVFGAGALPAPRTQELEALCAAVAARLEVADGHVAIEFVDAPRIAELNLAHRGKSEPTDVLSFPIDGVESSPAGEAPSPTPGSVSAGGVPSELGDIVICPEHTTDIREAVVHGMLHLLGMDHETDDGEMLALQCELLVSARR
jgi:probable rRNA maturation factor